MLKLQPLWLISRSIMVQGLGNACAKVCVCYMCKGSLPLYVYTWTFWQNVHKTIAHQGKWNATSKVFVRCMCKFFDMLTDFYASKWLWRDPDFRFRLPHRLQHRLPYIWHHNYLISTFRDCYWGCNEPLTTFLVPSWLGRHNSNCPCFSGSIRVLVTIKILSSYISVQAKTVHACRLLLGIHSQSWNDEGSPRRQLEHK